MPPYTSLWLQTLLEIKGTAAWLRTGEASPAAEMGVHAVRGAPLGIQRVHIHRGVGGTPPTSLWSKGHACRWTVHGLLRAPASPRALLLMMGPAPLCLRSGHLPSVKGPAREEVGQQWPTRASPGPVLGQALNPYPPNQFSEQLKLQKGNRGSQSSRTQLLGGTPGRSAEKCPAKDVHVPVPVRVL